MEKEKIRKLKLKFSGFAGEINPWLTFWCWVLFFYFRRYLKKWIVENLKINKGFLFYICTLGYPRRGQVLSSYLNLQQLVRHASSVPRVRVSTLMLPSMHLRRMCQLIRNGPCLHIKRPTANGHLPYLPGG